ncbi:hypothetical protein PBI_CLUBL_102 [Gordonia phage ClubL]|uniref:Uncharacterized protein n=1 Tax=Gordonia phage ClubL TaxID=1838065 RepID=A0A160DF55_9CAUD|nr:hypothetical protein BH768_gp105 [Gordonia phage ClubL]ANA86600.1 hypothetical protein PBI_CLUBL_102 [Gordonia phage ClubL]WNM66373.1 hypothetical protein SEA_CULVER_103 [Gordonia phage Culver]
MSNATCEFAHLFGACEAPANHLVTYRWWGRMLLCDQHFQEMNVSTDKHVLETLAI